jgi:hypothetical protein
MCILLLLLLCQVGCFWLTPGLAFAPLSGSALYFDVRLVTHCSDPCFVANASSNLEGRCGSAASSGAGQIRCSYVGILTNI